MNWILLSLQLLPAVLNAVVTIEQVAQGVPGATKKQMVLNIIQEGAKVASGVPNPTVQIVGQLIDSAVSQLNQSGVFQKK